MVPGMNPTVSGEEGPTSRFAGSAPSPWLPPRGSAQDTSTAAVSDTDEEAQVPVQAARTADWLEAHRETVGWIIAIAITVGVAIWIYVLQLSTPIPPGSDPGNWISISYAYIGYHYPGQVNPYGYPPLLFPILGGLVLATGSPIAAGHLIIPILITGLGLTTYALSRAILRSVTLSLAVLALLLLDPYFMTLFFWGALPNLLAFVFTNLALLGLVWTGTGKGTKGILFFWIFSACTVLSHSLGGLGLAATVAVALALSMFIPLQRVKGSTRRALDQPGLLLRRLIFSYPGYLGAIAFVAVVGGWYAGTLLTGVPHPSYFQPGSALHPATFGQFLRNLLPGLTLGKLAVFYILVGIVVFALAVFGGLLSLRPQWISTPFLVLIGAWIAIPGLAIIGWLLSVSTDYHRFGFLLVIPAGLSIAFLIDRLWLTRTPFFRSGPAPSAGSEGPTSDSSLRPFPPTIRASYRGRTAFLGVFAVVIILLAAAAAGPTYVNYVTANAGPSHDQLFLDSLNEIDHSGQPGAVLTVKGNLKWTWAITQRNAYAPRPGNAFLFYPVQITDSTLSYYALTSADAITNGLVSASIHGTNPTYVDGIPDIAVFQGGGLSATLQIQPSLVQVTLVGLTNASVYVVHGLAGIPTYQAPAAPGQPAVITYVENGFTLRQSVSIAPGSPTVVVNSSVQATGAYLVSSLQEVLTPPPQLGTYTQVTAIPGTFGWQPYSARWTGLMTDGSVTPAGAFVGVTNYPVSGQSSGGGGAYVDFTPTGSLPSAYINGSIQLTTPAATSSIPGLPSIINTVQVWQQLGIHFILLPNVQSFSLYAGSFLVNEALYLEGEFGCQIYYSNSEWIVLTVPTG
jgi:hypothetical protein